MPFNRPFPFIPDLPGMYILRGPRQIGKTCWLKTMLSFHAPKRKCFYFSCEEIEEFKELGTRLRSLRNYELILLDEISFVKGWDRAVKNFMDSGYKGILCLSGSHSYDLEAGVDAMPGRFGNGGEFYLLPMTFDEFCTARRVAGWGSQDRLENLKAYFKIGGFPTAIWKAGNTNRLPADIKSTYLRWLHGDVKKLGKDIEKLDEILIQIKTTSQNPVSFQTIAKKSSIGSPNTVIDYIRLLESSFAVRTLKAVNIDTGSPKFRSDKKFYFCDPLIYWIAKDLAHEAPSDQDESKIAEAVAYEHLARAYSRFGYFRNKKGEVDFVMPGKWAVEVKWSPIANDLSQNFHSLNVPEKIVWTYDNFLLEWPSNSDTVSR